MIFGSALIANGAVITHRDSYILEHITVASARRPFFLPGLLFAAGLGSFSWAFSDLLYALEQVTLWVTAGLCLIIGRLIGQLRLLSRDLRGSELAGAVYGTYGHLNRIRREIAAAVEDARHDG